MTIYLAETEQAIAACFPVMLELRPHLEKAVFVKRVQEQQSQGYLLACLEAEGAPVAVAGFRIGVNLAWGRFLYVDDLVTLSARRSHGYGKVLLTWLTEYAVKEGCAQLHLDSGMQRIDAHRFYEREGMRVAGYHFAQLLDER